MPVIRPNLWFDFGLAEQAAEFYCSVFPHSRVTGVQRYGPDTPGPEGSVMCVEFELDGTGFVAINGGPQFPFSEAVSLEIICADQAEIDRYWDQLTADGGQGVQCGWCRDRFGLSWQVVPDGMNQLLGDADAARAQRVMQAMLGMVKIDLAELSRAADGA